MNAPAIAYLSWRYLSYRPLRTLTLVGAVALTIYLPLALQVFTSESNRILEERARSTPLIVGPKGSSIDLTLNSLYFTPQQLPPLEYGAYLQAARHRFGTTIPIHSRFRTGEAPIVGTSLDYFEMRALDVADGRMITRLGDCVLGARVAKERGLKPGDKITSTPENVFDLAGVYPLRMRITGILAANRTQDDDAVFVDLKTAWVIEGLAHGHEDLTDPTASAAVREKQGDIIRANASVVEFNEVTDQNIDSFHFHGDQDHYPLSAALIIPHNERALAMALANYRSTAATEQIVEPLEAVRQLSATLFATRKLVIGALLLLGAAALALAALVFLLSFRLREREMLTYAKIGASELTLVILKSTEVVTILAAGILLAAGANLLTRALAAELLPELLN